MTFLHKSQIASLFINILAYIYGTVEMGLLSSNILEILLVHMGSKGLLICAVYAC
jgi:hypothetical protein